MSIVKSEDCKKWISAFLAIVSVVVCYVTIRFFYQMGEWFDLEAKINHYLLVVQGVGVVAGVLTFFFVFRNKKAFSHMQEVYGELVKVVWADRDSIFKITLGLVVALSILSGIFVLIDFSFRKLLELIY